MKSLILIAVSLFASAAMSAQTPDGNYALDKAHAHVGFSVTHLGFSNTVGRFNTFDGTFVFAANGESTVSFTIDAASVDTNNSQRDTHIKGEDFFDVDSFSTVQFTSTAFTYTAAGDPKTITGTLDFHGEQKSVTFNVSNVGAGTFQDKTRAGYKATTKINRGDFGMDTFQGVVGEEITITVNIELIKQ